MKFKVQSKFYLRVIPFLLVLLLFSGCAGMQIAALEKNQAEDIIKNKQTAMSVGQRTFDVSKKKLMKAFITAFSNRNLAVMNMDKELGFMVAEGGEFLDPAKVKKIGEERVGRLNEKTFPGAFVYLAGNYVLRITVNLFEKGKNRTLAKMGFTSVTVSTAQNKYDGVPSEFLPVYYEEMWDELEKAIFVQREMILN
jgi:hypothetical protein